LGYDEIKEFIETEQPKIVIPVHTKNPEVFKRLHDNVLIPKKGEKMPI
jgi:mRNA degradation ribonuclease J1/J2